MDLVSTPEERTKVSDQVVSEPLAPAEVEARPPVEAVAGSPFDGTSARCRFFALACGVTVAAIGTVVLFGWVFGIGPLTRPMFGAARLEANSALTLTLLGAAVVFAGRVRPSGDGRLRRLSAAAGRRVTIALALAAAAIGLATLVEYALSVNIGVDELIAGGPAGAASGAHPYRPASLAALMMLTAGLSLATVYRESRRAIALRQALALLTTLTAFFALLSHLYSADVLFGVNLRSSIGLPTVVGLLLAGLAALCLRPHDGWMRVITAEAAGSVAARRLLPVAIVGMPTIGFLRVIGTREGLFDQRFGAALAATVAVTLMTAAIVSLAVMLNGEQDRLLILEAARRRTQVLLNGLVDASESVIAIGDAEGRITSLNKAFERVRGIPRESAIGRQVRDFLPAADVESRERMIRRVIDRRERVAEELNVTRNDAAPSMLNVEMFPIEDERDKLIAVGMIATDITDSRLREERTRLLNAQLELESKRAAEAIAELESFAHTVSHDLRSPLRAIDGFAQVIESEYAEVLDQTGRHFLRRIRAGAKEMNALINGLLEFSRIGRSEMKFSQVDMTAAARNADELFAFEREGREVRVTIDELPPARADARLVGVVFMNLLSNAYKYSRKRDVAEIAVGAEREPNLPPTYFVRDNGIGFDMKHVGKLFGAFERLHSGGEYEGTGIGMATVQRVIRRHGGDIWAQSEPGVGTTIYFRLAGEAARGG